MQNQNIDQNVRWVDYQFLVIFMYNLPFAIVKGLTNITIMQLKLP